MTEQEKIEKAAEKLFPKEVVIGKPNTEKFTYNRMVEIQHDAFSEGASFYREQILPGMMEKFAEWIDKNGWVKTDAGHWSDYNDNRCTLEEVITNFLSHLKQKDNGLV